MPNYLESGADIIELPPEIKEVIDAQGLQVHKAIKELPESFPRRGVSEMELSAVSHVHQSTREGIAVTLDDICQRLGIPEHEIPHQREKLHAFFRSIAKGGTELQASSLVKPVPSKSGVANRLYFYLELKEEAEELSGKDYLPPIKKLEDAEWEFITACLEKASIRTRGLAHVLKGILSTLLVASKRKLCVSKRCVQKKVGVQEGRYIPMMALTQSILFAQFELAQEFRDIGFEIIDDDKRIQAVPTKSMEDVSEEDLTLILEQVKDLDIRIKEGLCHIEDYPLASKILLFIKDNPDCSLREIALFLDGEGSDSTGSMISRVITRIRTLNELDKKASPLGFNVYGRDSYSLGRSQKEHVPAVGQYQYQNDQGGSTLYPQPQATDFNLQEFEKTMQKKAPYLLESQSYEALIIRILACYSHYNFRISSAIIFQLLLKLKKDTKKSVANVEVSRLRKRFSEEGETGLGFIIAGDEAGYYLKSSRYGIVQAGKSTTSWSEFCQTGEPLPHEILQTPTEIFLENSWYVIRDDGFAGGKKAKKVAPDSPAYNYVADHYELQSGEVLVAVEGNKHCLIKIREAHLRPSDFEDAPTPMQATKKELPFPFPKKVSRVAIEIRDQGPLQREELLEETKAIVAGKIAKKTKGVSAIKRALLCVLAESTLEGQSLLLNDLAKSIGIDEAEKEKFRKELISLIAILRDSPNTPLTIIAQKLPQRVNNQWCSYHLDLKRD